MDVVSLLESKTIGQSGLVSGKLPVPDTSRKQADGLGCSVPLPLVVD
jgi:hypothetical protein